eukprot:TRINITY_DN1161_c1_g2_i14.p1 TRINITY_DN1161_c1_g2~~TRINITY_DN1161_c1_g2_i14.p1  ORF type:complete len:141 (-),score=25.46 TRINITY_DN1161_c1_g2_i14:429-851(-)
MREISWNKCLSKLEIISKSILSWGAGVMDKNQKWLDKVQSSINKTILKGITPNGIGGSFMNNYNQILNFNMEDISLRLETKTVLETIRGLNGTDTCTNELNKEWITWRKNVIGTYKLGSLETKGSRKWNKYAPGHLVTTS